MAQKKEAERPLPAKDSANVFANGVKLVGEALLPGASLILDGKVVNGAAHAAVGFAARLAAGPAGLVIVAADSYSKSVSDKYLWEHARELWQRNRPGPAAEAEQAAG